MTVQHAAVWIDNEEAKIFHIKPEGFEASTVKAPHRHVTRKGKEQGGHAGKEGFFHEVAEALKDAEEILVVGPSSAKLDFIRHVHKHDHALEPKILGVETLDHPSDGQIAAFVRHYFVEKGHAHGLSP
ncbi:MAG: translational machinery protein [Polyangiaceae bacterium]